MATFAYVDNSNLWIEGQRLMAVQTGLAADPYDAMRRRLVVPWSYSFRRLYELVCPPPTLVGRAALFASSPRPRDDPMWARAAAAGFTPKIFTRTRREKQVDLAISTMIVEDSFRLMRPGRGDQVVLVSGDGDFIPTVRSVQERGLRVRIIGWRHATNAQLREVADDYLALDRYFSYLTFSVRGKWPWAA